MLVARTSYEKSAGVSGYEGWTLGLPLGTLCAFLLVLARVAGVAAFLPLPGLNSAPGAVRVVLALAVTCALFPAWPSPANSLPSFGQLSVWVFAETGFGLAIGLAVSLLTEGFQIAAQLIGVQAGYSYATTVDPTSQADSGVLEVLNQLLAGLLLFAFGIDRELFRVLAASFQKFPAGSWTIAVATADGLVKLGSGMFSLGLRMAMPVMALMLLLDLALALLGRMQQQLHLLSLAFPLKMMAALALLAVLIPTFSRLFESASARMLERLWHGIGF
jgi:flagellar biosynthesis protein FliR